MNILSQVKLCEVTSNAPLNQSRTLASGQSKGDFGEGDNSRIADGLKLFSTSPTERWSLGSLPLNLGSPCDFSDQKNLPQVMLCQVLSPCLTTLVPSKFYLLEHRL